MDSPSNNSPTTLIGSGPHGQIEPLSQDPIPTRKLKFNPDNHKFSKDVHK